LHQMFLIAVSNLSKQLLHPTTNPSTHQILLISLQFSNLFVRHRFAAFLNFQFFSTLLQQFFFQLFLIFLFNKQLKQFR
jgi:hypothetical protein